jgi:hypothetical protein
MSSVEHYIFPSGSEIHYYDEGHHWCTKSPEQHVVCNNRCTGRVVGASTLAKNDGSPGADGLISWALKFADQEGGWVAERDRLGEIGTAAHTVLEHLAEHDEVPPFTGGHDLAVIDWWKKRRPEPIYIEQAIYDAERGYAGRFDLMFGPETPTMLDLKTGSIRAASAIQLNLYALGCRAAGLTVPERLLVLDTSDDGSWAEIEIPINPGWAMAALATYRNGQEIRRVLTQSKKKATRSAALEAAA